MRIVEKHVLILGRETNECDGRRLQRLSDQLTANCPGWKVVPIETSIIDTAAIFLTGHESTIAVHIVNDANYSMADVTYIGKNLGPILGALPNKPIVCFGWRLIDDLLRLVFLRHDILVASNDQSNDLVAAVREKWRSRPGPRLSISN